MTLDLDLLAATSAFHTECDGYISFDPLNEKSHQHCGELSYEDDDIFVRVYE